MDVKIVKVKNQYIIEDIDDAKYNIKCCVKSNPENSYDTTYYFHDGDRWIKDFIDITKLSPEDKDEKDKFDEFITHLHDYIVHDHFWEDLAEIEVGESLKSEEYKVVIRNNTQ